MNLWAALLPLVVFVVIDSLQKPKLAIYSAMTIAVGFLIYDTVTMGHLDWTLTFEPVLICICGVVSLKMQRTNLFRYQPTVLGVLLGLFILGFQLLNEPILVRYWDIAKRHMGTDAIPIDKLALIEPKLPILSLVWGIIILAHGVFMYWATKKFGNLGWILCRVTIYPALIFSGILMVAF